ncbi:MAG: tetratricopeptide repeat protein [Planctomycetota bacterium]
MMQNGWRLIVGGVVVAGLAVGSIGVTRVLTEPGGKKTHTPKHDPKALEGVIAAATAKHRQGLIGEAIAITSEGVETWPESREMWLVHAEILMGDEAWAEAYDAFRVASRFGENEADAEIRFTMGTLAFQMGNLEQSASDYRRAQQLAPGEAKYPLYLAQVLRRQGDLDGARAALGRVTVLDDSIPQAWASLAGIASDAGNLEAALEYARKARTLAPEELGWRSLEASILRRGNRAEEAAILMLAALETLGEREPRAEIDAVEEAALALGAMGEPDRAAELWARTADAWPASPKANFEAAVGAERIGEASKGVKYAERAALLGHPLGEAVAARLRQAAEGT